jgi:hypothetical protein
VAYKRTISAESEQDIAIDMDMKSQGDTGVTRAIELEATERLRADSAAIQIQSKLDSPTSKDLPTYFTADEQHVPCRRSQRVNV